ncbi:MAG: hypothetical protein Q8R47_02615 [Nanoarchaeota archaeon]|nr:hypothetical protein [Nanoarchaeota archaeon]
MKQKKPVRKSSRHHWFLVSVFVIIVLLGITAYILQRTTDLETIAGEAIRQRVEETRQLASSAQEAKVAAAIRSGEKIFFQECPSALESAAEQHWKLAEGWGFQSLKVVDVRCVESAISCYYADSETEINRADQVVTYLRMPSVKNCKADKSGNTIGCNCEIVLPPGQPGPPSLK